MTPRILWLEESTDDDENGIVHVLFKTDQGHSLLDIVNGSEWTDGWEGEISTDFQIEHDDAQDLLTDLYNILYSDTSPKAESRTRTPELEVIFDTLESRFDDWSLFGD